MKNTGVCYRGQCSIDLRAQSAAAALNKNSLVKAKEGFKKVEKKEKQVGGGWW